MGKFTFKYSASVFLGNCPFDDKTITKPKTIEETLQSPFNLLPIK